MNTAQVSIELILAGILALCAFVLPFWTGSDISTDLLQSNALIGILGIAYLLGVMFDKLADTILSPFDQYLRLRQADKYLKSNPKYERDPFPQNKLEFNLRKEKDGRLEWMDSLKSRIRTSRELAVLGLPATLGIAIYQGITKDCTGACLTQWPHLFVVLNLLFLAISAVLESRSADEDSKNSNQAGKRLKTDDLKTDPAERKIQLENAGKQMLFDSWLYYLLLLTSVTALIFVSTFKPENAWIALFGAGGLIITLLAFWTWHRVTRTYMKFIAREMDNLLVQKRNSK